MFQLLSVNDLQAPQQWGSHISACFKGKDRKIAAAYFTVIFDAVIKGNPIPYWPALVTSGTYPRFCHIFVAITTQSCVWLKLYLFKFTDLINKYLLISWYVETSIGNYYRCKKLFMSGRKSLGNWWIIKPALSQVSFDNGPNEKLILHFKSALSLDSVLLIERFGKLFSLSEVNFVVFKAQIW